MYFASEGIPLIVSCTWTSAERKWTPGLEGTDLGLWKIHQQVFFKSTLQLPFTSMLTALGYLQLYRPAKVKRFIDHHRSTSKQMNLCSALL